MLCFGIVYMRTILKIVYVSKMRFLKLSSINKLLLKKFKLHLVLYSAKTILVIFICFT